MDPQEKVIVVDDIGSLAAMKDGRIITCYTEWESDWLQNLDQERSEQWAYLRYSSDSGQTWTAPTRAIAFPPGRGGTWAGIPLVDHDGKVHVFSLRFYSVREPLHSVLLHNVSHDGGRTWSEAREIDYGHQYTGALNYVLQMDSGRILVPLSYTEMERSNGRCVSMVVYSDDGGQTWSCSNDLFVTAGGQSLESGAIEPVVVQFPSGLVWMVIRTTTGYFWESFSNDGGIWTPPIGTRIVSSNAPAGVLRLRDGRIVLFWNRLYGEPFARQHPDISYARQVLSAAISRDEGQTWSRPKAVAQRRPDELPNTQVCYPFPCQAPDGQILLSYTLVGATPERGWNRPMRELVRVDPEWLAEPAGVR